MANLQDDQLLARVLALGGHERRATTLLIVHLAELDRRRLYLGEGYSSLFTWCTEVLRLSEQAAYARIQVARASRLYPAIIEKLADGSVHLTGLILLAPHLTDGNHRALLEAATHRSKRDVAELVAGLKPLPDVPTSIRRLPAVTPAGSGRGDPSAGSATRTGEPGHHNLFPLLDPAEAGEVAPGGPAVSSSSEHLADPNEPLPLRSLPSLRNPPTFDPLSPGRYRVQFTADADLHALFRQVRELMRHRVPTGDPAAIFTVALEALIEKLTRRKFAALVRPSKAARAEAGEGQSKRPGPSDGEAEAESGARGKSPPMPGRPSAQNSRHIPARVRRRVWRRDAGRCAFRGRDGRRCAETGHLEFHHRVPYARGGPATAGNIELRCRAHNEHESERDFGHRHRPGPAVKEPSPK